MINMKKLSILAIAIFSVSSQAQNTFVNEQITNNSSDVIGTARYVGMGGAMGALGADISTISWNPAGIALYRKNDVALTFGGLWGKSHIDEENRGAASFDQMGFVYNIKVNHPKVPYVNLSFNYQKKINYNYNFYADNGNIRGLSQMDQLTELVNQGWDTDWNLAGLVITPTEEGSTMLTPIVDGGNNVVGYENNVRGQLNNFTHHSEGWLQGYDFNISTNVNDRAYLGLTFGVDNLSYSNWTIYGEMAQSDDPNDDYWLNNDTRITGYGINVKLGAIVRPVEESSFRLGLVMETPTWYRLKNSTYYNIESPYNSGTLYESYLEYTVRTPWKVRACMGSTIGNWMAWDVDYEYANYSKTKMGYPKWDEWDDYHSSFRNTTDKAMNEHTSKTLKGVHTVRAGLEFHPTSAFAIRLGYNYISPAYEKNATFDQFSIDSNAMNFATSTNYMNLGCTNMLTLGVGYRYKKFYVDLAYKVRNQNADFYAFDSSFTSPNTDFSHQHPDLAGVKLDPVDVDLTRQSISCTLGFKF